MVKKARDILSNETIIDHGSIEENDNIIRDQAEKKLLSLLTEQAIDNRIEEIFEHYGEFQ